MGTSPFACPALTALLESAAEVVGVFTQPDKPQGRGLKVRISAVKALAERSGLPVYQPKRINQEESFECIRALSPDVIVVVAYGQILPKRILEYPRCGCINVHASLLPKYRGSAPINWAITKGEETTGVTTMLMDEGLDTGDILMQRTIDIPPDETAGELHDRLAQLGAGTLVETLEKWKKGEIAPHKQNDSEATFAPLLKKEDGLINWELPAEKIANQIRGMDPWPGAYTYIEGKRLKVFRGHLVEKDSRKKPGTIIDISDAGITVSAGENRLLIAEVQLESRKRVASDTFLRGHPIPVGTQLGEY
jgi:methionyl-tRNA formyltransferase